MKKYIFLILIIIFCCRAKAQNISGVTGIRDTSFSTYSAYLNAVKAFPKIKIVAEQPSKLVSESRDLTYCTIGNRALKADAFIPKNRKTKTLAVLIIHGGGWRTGNRSQHIPLAQRLAAEGFACFTAEYRLSTEALFPAGVYDLKAALRWMRANAVRFNLDTARIAVLGFSAGGELAAFLGGTAGRFEDEHCNPGFSTTVQAIVDIDGTLSFVNQESAEGDDSRSTSAGTYWFGYSKKANPKLWADASPLNHAAEVQSPTLFLNSSLPYMHAGREDYIHMLNQKNIYTEVHTFEGAPHTFCLFDPWFEPTVKYTIAFLNKVFTK